MNRRVVALTVAGLTVAVVGLTVALIVVASDSGGGSTTTTTSSLVPIVIGKDEAKAKAILRGAGFEVAATPGVPNLPGFDTPAGTVVDQDPPAGSPADPGSTVTLAVADGS